MDGLNQKDKELLGLLDSLCEEIELTVSQEKLKKDLLEEERQRRMAENRIAIAAAQAELDKHGIIFKRLYN